MVKIERQTLLYYHVYLLQNALQITLTLVNEHLRGKNQPYELNNKSRIST